MLCCTEEGQKVDRNGGSKYYAVYQRMDAKDEIDIDVHNFFANKDQVGRVYQRGKLASIFQANQPLVKRYLLLLLEARSDQTPVMDNFSFFYRKL
jgi:hypothetical protein